MISEQGAVAAAKLAGALQRQVSLVVLHKRVR